MPTGCGPTLARMHEDPTRHMEARDRLPPDGGYESPGGLSGGTKALLALLVAAVIGLGVALVVLGNSDDSTTTTTTSSSTAPSTVTETTAPEPTTTTTTATETTTTTTTTTSTAESGGAEAP